MNISVFLQLDGVQGEATAIFHEGDIEVIDWGWGVSNTAALQMKSSEASAHTEGDDLTITKGIDTASKTLIQNCALGTHITKGRLTCEKNDGGERLAYLVIEFEDLKVMSVKTAKGADQVKTEDVVFKYAKFKISYGQQLNTGEG